MRLAVARAIKEREEAKIAADPARKGGRPSKTAGESPAVSEAGRAADIAAAAVGMSRPTLAKATEVVEAAEADPEHADLVNDRRAPADTRGVMHVQDRREAPLMTAKEAARTLGVTPRTVTRLAQSGDLRAIRLGERGRWRILRRAVDEIVRGEPTTDAYGSVRSAPTRQRDEEERE